MHILSIQSSVAYGHAGNSAATFPLQRLGHEVWPVLTVHFSNHTGYGSFRGEVFDPATVADVIQGVDERGALARTDVVLTGYQGSPGVAEVVLDTVALVKSKNPAAVYCCDPVMGDVGKGMYVLPGIPELLRDRVVPASDVLCPNVFELAYLAGTGGDPKTATPADVRTTEGLLDAVDTVMAMGPKVTLVTSIEDGVGVLPEPGGSHGIGDTGEFFGVQREGVGGNMSMIAVNDDGAWRVTTPRLPLEVNGAGDVTTALFVAHLLTVGIEEALARTASSVYGILRETMRRIEQGDPALEIALIAAQDVIADPPCEFEVERLR